MSGLVSFRYQKLKSFGSNLLNRIARYNAIYDGAFFASLCWFFNSRQGHYFSSPCVKGFIMERGQMACHVPAFDLDKKYVRKYRFIQVFNR